MMVAMSGDRTRRLAALAWLLGALALPAGAEPPAALVRDVNTAPSPQVPPKDPAYFVGLGGRAFFAASRSDVGTELWSSDTSFAGTLPLDLVPGSGSSGPLYLRRFGDRIYFSAMDATGRELWTSDGTLSGTFRVKDIFAGAGSSQPFGFAAANGFVLFSASTPETGSELWRTNGTEAGTKLVKDVYPGNAGSGPSGLRSLGGLVFFAGRDETHGNELWQSDGTAAGTRIVEDIAPGPTSSSPEILAVGDGRVLFAATSNTQRELWKSDGTPAGTSLITSVALIHGPAVWANGLLFFQGNDLSGHGDELWTSDLTAAGTLMVKDILPGSSSSNVQWIVDLNGVALFSAQSE
jgi:ELWxxDGT repeat protein